MRCSSIVALFFISGAVVQTTHAQSSSAVSQVPRTSSQSPAVSDKAEVDPTQDAPHNFQVNETRDVTASAETQPQSASQWLAELQNIITNANFQVSFVQTIAG